MYKIQLRNLAESVLAQGMFYEGDQIQLKYEFENSPISTTMSKNNGTTYATLVKETGDTGPRYVNYTVSASDANTDDVIIFKRENDANGRSHGFKTVEWELVESAPVPSEPAGGMEDRVETFTLPYNGQWSRTFQNLDAYDAEGNPFMYWFEETGTTNANGYFPVTVNDADRPLEIDQTAQIVKNMKKAAIKVIKVIKGTETGIQGAKFTLTQVDEEGHALPGGIVKTEVSTDGNGVIIFDNLEPGRYELAETKVPDGYIKNEGLYYIFVNDDYTTTLDTSVAHTLITKAETSSVYTVQNEPGVALPNTGGPGTGLFTIIGSMLIFGAGVLLWGRWRLI